ncbi:MAG: DNA starvation/stationary phase protection protein Dps [Phormidesmis sp. RL_2_1]|nr:DNA starvation/stationary phase protection protein Dps [Phormidesmis sp. RL_2_1]
MVATTSQTSFYPTRIDLPLETRQSVADMLNTTLAATTDLRTQTKQAHWNVKGKDFYQLHLLFDEMAGELEAFSDMVAERVTALAGTAMGTVRVAASRSILPEYDFDAVGGMEHVAALADRYAAYAKHLRTSIDQADELGDQDTNDLYVEISRTIDKRLWFLEAHLVG